MTAQRESPSWHEAAQLARFAFYEPVAPDRTRMWAGGFGWRQGEPESVELLAEISGVEVCVETSLHQSRSSIAQRLRLSLSSQLWHFLVGETSELELPLSIDVVADDRTILVNGAEITFTGIRIVGSSNWVGLAELDDVVLKVGTAADIAALSIETCRDWSSLPEIFE